MTIKDRVVLITGASEGIGYETAKLLAHEGALVAIVARSREKLEAAHAEIPGSLAIIADIRKQEDIERMVRETLDRFGRVDILINNAGQAIYGRLDAISIEDYRTVLELNVIGALSAMQQVLPAMRRQGEGMIINVSSGTSKMVLPGVGAYASTKSALNMLSSVAREELKDERIVVSTIYPFITRTQFAENAIGTIRRPTHAVPAGRPAPHSANFVAEKIRELIATEASEMVLIPGHEQNPGT